jgi:hypothetical protein
VIQHVPEQMTSLLSDSTVYTQKECLTSLCQRSRYSWSSNYDLASASYPDASAASKLGQLAWSSISVWESDTGGEGPNTQWAHGEHIVSIGNK